MPTAIAFTYNANNDQKVRFTDGGEVAIDLYGAGSQTITVLGVTKATIEDFPTVPGYGSIGGDRTQMYYWVAFKVVESDASESFRVKSFEINNIQGGGGPELNGIRPAMLEEFFGSDLNGDGTRGLPTVADDWKDVTTDTVGVTLKVDFDDMLYVRDGSSNLIVLPKMGGSFKINQSTSTNETKAVAVTRVETPNGLTEPEYLLAVKRTDKDQTSGQTTSTEWEIYTLRSKEGWMEWEAARTTTNTTGAAGGYTPPSPGAGNFSDSEPNALYFDWEVTRPSSISEFEQLFGQDLDGDGQQGVRLDRLTPADTKTSGVRLEKDPSGGLYIVDGTGNSKTAKGIENLSSVQYQWGEGTGNFERSKVVAVEAVREGNTITAYKIAVKKESSWDPFGGVAGTGSAPGSGSTGTTTPTIYVRWEVLHLDATTPKITWGGWDSTTNTWVDKNERNLKSISGYELFFGQDLDGDGKTGVDVAALKIVETDTAGARLARAADQSLFIVEGTGSAATAKPVKADWLEQNYVFDADSYNKREAIAVEVIKDSNNVTTGYRLLVKNANKWGASGSENVTFDILRLDATGKLNTGQMVSATWVDNSTYGIKSLASYEQDFGQDLNGDGRVGVDVATLSMVRTDTTGIRLARDASGGLFLLEGSGANATAKGVGNGGFLESSYTYFDGFDIRQAVAAEAVRDGNNVITGYKLAIRQTRKNDSTTETFWEVLSLGADGNVNWGGAMAGGQLKSIAAYEPDFNQDLNGDGRIGIDVASLRAVTTDTTGETLARDAEGTLYIITNGNAKAVAGSSRMEFNDQGSWGANSRTTIAVEAERTNNVVTGYKLAVSNMNRWDSGGGNANTQRTFDILHLNSDGSEASGSMVNNQWVEKSIYGLRSLVPYEVTFNQDFNGDGIVGIDVSSLTEVATDKRGVRLRRDKENALYLIDEAPGSTPKAIGNASWLEYSNSWGSGSNAREAVAIGSTVSNGSITGYRLAVKNTNQWDNRTDVNWEILSLDADGRITWGMTPASGASIWTTNIRPFETLVGEDLDGDGNIGVSRSALTVLESDTSNDGVTLARDADGMLYVLDGANTTIALRDSYGGTPMLEFTRGSNRSEVIAAGKDNNGQYKIAVKITTVQGTTERVSWQIHSVSSDGVLDWSKVATARSPVRFETMIGQDLDGDDTIGQAAAALEFVGTDTGAFRLQKDAAGQLYIRDTLDTTNDSLTFIVDSRGGAPSFDQSFTGFKSEAYAVHMQSDGAYRLAVKKTTTTTAGESVKWDVHYINARNSTTKEAVIDWSKSSFPRTVAEVERLVNQDIDGDGLVPNARSAPSSALASDTAGVGLGRDAEGFLWIRDANSSWLSVKDIYGLGVNLNVSEAWDANESSFVATPVAAMSFTENNVIKYRIAVKEVLTLKDMSAPTTTWKIYTVVADGTINFNPITTQSIARWETASNFGQDLDGQSLTAQPYALDSDLAFDSIGGTYVLRQNSYVVVTDGSDGQPNFAFTETFDGGSIQSRVVGAAAGADGNMLIAVEQTSTIGSDASRIWTVHTLTYDDNDTAQDATDDYFAIDWSKAVVTADMSTYSRTFGQEFLQPGVVTGASVNLEVPTLGA